MTVRERFQAIMEFKPYDRLPILEWAGWWNDTIKRWVDDGLPSEYLNRDSRTELCNYFGLDRYLQGWFRPIHWEAPKPLTHGAGLFSGRGTNFERSYEKLLPYLFQIQENWPINKKQWHEWSQLQKRGDAVVWLTVNGFFWFPRELFGIENHLYAFYEYPDLMHRINNANADFIIKIINELCEICTPDFMTFAEDMSYNNGPMISGDLFDEFMLPYYKKVIPCLKDRGIIPFIDSDGDVTMAAPWFDKAGIEGILPLECQAGTNLNTLRQNHPKMKFIGHFDKMVMDKGENAMRSEFERLLPLASEGGFLISCDHQTPPGVSLADYRCYLQLFREYAKKAAVL